ncbi:dentin sialophosphoprotein-like [Sturnira hondurensis]|uniref:dentin sialophosphoprotein-like n=1 Tax=Sturnira hondurensis TaxID=192404 RepID=UPI00187AEE53|nr:dentin sialophosphoprotein-like [Sturnira hondurensis]
MSKFPESCARVSGIQHEEHLTNEKIVRCKEVSPTVSDKQASQQKLKGKHSHNVSLDPNTLVGNKDQINASHKISSYKSCCKEYRQVQSFQSSQSQINLLNAEDNNSEVSAIDCNPISMSPKTHSDTMDTRATICPKCFMEINNSSFHKCLGNSNNDSDSDSPLHLQSSFCSKYCLSPRPVRQGKTSQKISLSQALDLEHMVGIHCPKHGRDSKYSSGSTSYLHCENCLALQNLIHSTVTKTFPMNPENTTSHHSTSEPDNINVSNVIGLESEVQFNLTTQPENEANSDNKTELVSGDNLKSEAITKDKPLLKDERDHEDESDSEDETESEDEEDAENKNNTKDKKDPKDKSDRDDNDPKGSNSEKDADTNNGSDSSSNADHTSGADSSGDGNSNNGTDCNGRHDSNIDKGTNNDANSKHSSDSEEEKCTNNLDSASGLDNDQHCTTGFDNGTNPNHTCEVQNGTGMDCTSNSNDDAGLGSATRSGNGIYLYNGTGTTKEAGPNNNRPGPNLNESVLQKNGPGPQNNGQCPNLPGFNNNGSGLNTNPILNNNSPGPNDNISVLENDTDFNNNARPYHANHNSSFSSHKDVDSNYDTKSTSDFDHNCSAVPNYYSDLDCVSRFIQIVGSSFVVNPNNITKSSYAVRPSSTNGNGSGNGNVSDGGNSTNCRGAISPSYIAFISYGSDTIHETKFIHVIGSIFVTTPNYDAVNIINVHDFTSTTNINFPVPNLEIGSSFSISNIVYDSTSTFVADTNYTFTPENLTTSTSFDLYKFGGNYTSTGYDKFGVYPKANDGSMDSIFMHATESKYVLDAKESGLSKYFSSVQNPIGIKGPSSLNFYHDSNILLLSFGIIVEAEQPDVVKFAISSGAVNQFVKMSPPAK